MEVEDLDRRYRTTPPSPRDAGRLELIVARKGDGVHEIIDRAVLDPDLGLEGDRWHTAEKRKPDAQISLMNTHVVRTIAPDHHLVPDAGDNLLVDLDLSLEALPPGTRLRIGTALLEITPEPHTGCKKFHARFGSAALRWINHRDRRDERLRGVYGRVIEGGIITTGDAITRCDDTEA
jgi:MOSC domain-containing protein YiiM